MYRLTTLVFIKLLEFDILGYFLGYTISKGMVWDILIILLFDQEFPMVSQVTQIEIIYKNYAHRKLMYQLTT